MEHLHFKTQKKKIKNTLNLPREYITHIIYTTNNKKSQVGGVAL